MIDSEGNEWDDFECERCGFQSEDASHFDYFGAEQVCQSCASEIEAGTCTDDSDLYECMRCNEQVSLADVEFLWFGEPYCPFCADTAVNAD
ncbi:MAG: hypothetical protein Q7J21_00190 [Rugosibacter sp.]|nr:hypothetical protein [Rugosibacter sp.]